MNHPSMRISIIVIAILGLLGCHISKKAQEPVINDGILRLTILQVNDVYEIAPLNDGKVGGIARLATLKKQLLADNPNTISVLCGDFINPSVFTKVPFDSLDVCGIQMIDALNAAEIDYVSFGNHEFDNKLPHLQRVIDRSNFEWIAGNVRGINETGKTAFVQNGKPLSESLTLTFTDQDSTIAQVGVFSTCLTKTKPKYVDYEEPKQWAINASRSLSTNCDVVVGMTHQDRSDDTILARKIADTRTVLLMGGHDHVRSTDVINGIVVAKADANAKTAMVHDLIINTANHTTRVFTRVVALDEQIPLDVKTDSVVQHWMGYAEKKLIEKGINIHKTCLYLAEPLDGRESTVRFEPCLLGHYIATAMAGTAKTHVDAAFFNSGSIRVDDILTDGVTEWDVLRVLPYGGELVECDVNGGLLNQLFNASKTLKGQGAFLQYYQVERGDKWWIIDGNGLDSALWYHIVTTRYLAEGKQPGLEFFNTTDTFAIKNVQIGDKNNLNDPKGDIVKAVIRYLKSINDK
jgi:5'-nucleotidase / UDP-sugar diphosphatase